MKKFVSAILSVVFVFLLVSEKSFAISENRQGHNKPSQNSTEKLDLSQYTFDDILKMSADEYMSLVKEFEKHMIRLIHMILSKKRRKTRAIIWFHLFGHPERLKMMSGLKKAVTNTLHPSLASFSPMIKGSFPITTGTSCISFYQYPLPLFFPIETRSELRYSKGTFTILTQERAMQTQPQIRQK